MVTAVVPSDDMRLESMAVLLGSAAFLASAGCGGDDSGNDTTGSGGTGATGGTTSATGGMASTSSGMGAGGMGTGAGGSAPGGYPEGPYGPQEGLTFPQLTFHGYLSTDPAALATTETWTETYTSQDLFESGAAYALVHTSLSG